MSTHAPTHDQATPDQTIDQPRWGLAACACVLGFVIVVGLLSMVTEAEARPGTMRLRPAPTNCRPRVHPVHAYGPAGARSIRKLPVVRCRPVAGW